MLIQFHPTCTTYNLNLIFLHFLDTLSSFGISSTIRRVMNYVDLMTKNIMSRLKQSIA